MNDELDKNENPYIAVISKKCRNLKKKLNQIQKVDEQLAIGKILNEEQRVLLSTRPMFERQLQDLDALKSQLEEVAAMAPVPEPVPVPEPEPAQEAVVQPTPFPLAVVQPVQPQVQKENGKPSKAKKTQPAVPTPTPAVAAAPSEEVPAVARKTVVVAEAGTETMPMQSTSQSTQASLAQKPRHQQSYAQSIEKNLSGLLKALHVYRRYADYTGKPLPDEVELLGMTLLGQTCVSGFDCRLSQSVRTAGLYLDDDLSSDNTLSGRITFKEIQDMVHSLSLEMEVDPKKTVPPAPLETSMLFGDVMVSFDTEDSGSSYSFSPATAAIAIEKPVIEKKNRKERGGRGGGDRRDKKSPPDSIVSVAETALAFAPVVVPTSMKHPDLYAAVAPQVPDTAAAASAPRSERERPRPRKDGDKAGSLDNSNNSMPLKAVATDNLKRDRRDSNEGRDKKPSSEGRDKKPSSEGRDKKPPTESKGGGVLDNRENEYRKEQRVLEQRVLERPAGKAGDGKPTQKNGNEQKLIEKSGQKDAKGPPREKPKPPPRAQPKAQPKA